MSGRNNKRKGTRNEHKSMRRQEATGGYVTRSGGSLGMFDYVAVNPKERLVLLSQVKSNRNPSRAEMEGLVAFARSMGSSAPCAGCGWSHRVITERWDDYAREPKVLVV